jgi:hypothetical protein
MIKSMSVTSIDGFATSHLPSILANQLTSHSLGASSRSTKDGHVPSAFAQLLSEASAAESQAAKPQSTASKVGSFLSHLVSLL